MSGVKHCSCPDLAGPSGSVTVGTDWAAAKINAAVKYAEELIRLPYFESRRPTVRLKTGRFAPGR